MTKTYFCPNCKSKLSEKEVDFVEWQNDHPSSEGSYIRCRKCGCEEVKEYEGEGYKRILSNKEFESVSQEYFNGDYEIVEYNHQKYYYSNILNAYYRFSNIEEELSLTKPKNSDDLYSVFGAEEWLFEGNIEDVYML